MKHKVIIQNLKCGGCGNTITKGVSKLEGVSDVNIDVESSTVEFDCDEEKTKAVLVKLKELGYPSVDEDNPFLTQTKSFVSCAVGRVTK